MLSETQHSEDFFRHQSAGWSMTLLEAQLAALKKTPHGNNLFINLPITVLTEPASFQRLINLKNTSLNIEIVDLSAFLAFRRTEAARHSKPVETPGTGAQYMAG